jgi:hypothetical protein
VPSSLGAWAGAWDAKVADLGGCVRWEMRQSGPCSSLQYFVSCDSIDSLPTLNFIINGVQFPLEPSAYIISVSPALRGQSHQDMGGREEGMQSQKCSASFSVPFSN